MADPAKVQAAAEAVRAAKQRVDEAEVAAARAAQDASRLLEEALTAKRAYREATVALNAAALEVA